MRIRFITGSRAATVALIVFTVLLSAAEVKSQERAADSASQAAYDAGAKAASSVSVTGRAFGGFASGVLLGSVAPVAIYGRNTLALGATAIGIGSLIASARAGDARPPQLLLDGVDRSAQPAFIEGYSKRLRKRRARAALIGGGTGAVVGAGALVAFLVKLSND